MEANLTIAGEIIEANKVKDVKDDKGSLVEIWNYVIKQNDFGREDTCIPFTAYNPKKKKWPLDVGRNVRVDLCVMGYKKGRYWFVTAKCLKVWVDATENDYRKITRRRTTVYDDIPIDIIRDENGDSPRIEDTDF